MAPIASSNPSARGDHGASDDDPLVERVPDAVDDAVTKRPWVGHVLRIGWGAKGVVYVLMGFTAITVARHASTPDEASPEGALGQLSANPGGRALLLIAGGGLLLYATYRVLSAALVRGADVGDWMDRAGYMFSAVFYVMIGAAAIAAAVHGDRPEDSNAVERVSSWALGMPAGRWLLLVGGMVVVGIGVYFVIDRGLKRSFLDDLSLADAVPGEREAVVWTGTVGWIGRGIVTGMVGVFIARAAWSARHDEARGFDRALREVASSHAGSLLVGGSGVALVLYGVFCIAAVRHLEIEG